MASSSARITLSIGRSSDGPRTVGDINAFGLSFAIYQIWMYMAVFGATKTFRPSELVTAFPFFEMWLQPFLIYPFLISSAICLIVYAILERKTCRLVTKRTALIAITGLCLFGTILIFFGSGGGVAVAVVAGVLMGIGASAFLALWGCAFACFEFATTVINAAIAFAVGLIAAIALINWVPSPFSGAISCLLPILMALVFWKRNSSSASTSHEGIETRYVRGYLVRFAVCVALFGVVLGAFRAICGTQLLSFSSISVELALGLGCMSSVAILLGAMIFSKRETSWDSLFRTVSPAVVLGIVGLTMLMGSYSILGGFFAAMGYVCLETLLWILLASMAKNLNGSAVAVFGLGYGLMQAASIVGIGLSSDLIGQAGLLDLPVAQAEMSNLALALVTIVAFGYAVLPRYRELKALLASVISIKDAETIKNDELEESVATSTSDVEASTSDAGTSIDESIGESTDKDAKPKPAAPATAAKNDQSQSSNKTGASIAQEEGPATQPTTRERGSFMRRCDQIATEYLLSEREREVMILLAKGHNAAFITDKLCISRSTTKTHINHIYKKLDIHMQQDLLNMVEDRIHKSSENVDDAFEHVATLGAMGAAVPQNAQVLKDTVLNAQIRNHKRKA